MTLTVSNLANYGGIHLGDGDGTGGVLSAVEVANDAGHHFCSFPWKWMQERTAYIDLRAPFTVTAGTTDSTTGQILSETGTFANYVFVPGDVINVTTATGGDTGRVQIAGRISDDQIALVTSINTASGTAASAVAASFSPVTMALPADFRSIDPARGISDTNAQFTGIDLVTRDRLNYLRSSEIDSTIRYKAAITSGSTPKTTIGSTVYYNAPRPVLEHYPASSAASAEQFSVMYRRGWRVVDSDNDYIEIPDWAEPCFKQLYRAFVQGYLEDDEIPMDVRLNRWEMSSLTRRAMARDGSSQPHYGKIRNGAAQKYKSQVDPLYTNWTFDRS